MGKTIRDAVINKEMWTRRRAIITQDRGTDLVVPEHEAEGRFVRGVALPPHVDVGLVVRGKDALVA